MSSKQANAKLALRITGGVFQFVLNVLFYCVVVTCVITFSKSAYNFSYQVFGDVTVDQEDAGREVKVRIKKGDSTMEVARRLEQNKIIQDKYTFYLKAKLRKTNVMPGTYIVRSDMTYDDIFATISDVNNSLTQEEYMDDGDKGSKDQGSKEEDSAQDNEKNADDDQSSSKE